MILSEIILPEHAPKRFSDRSTLWNEVEQVEKHYKAQLAYSFDMALQNEFSLEENIELAREFVQKYFVSDGMICRPWRCISQTEKKAVSLILTFMFWFPSAL